MENVISFKELYKKLDKEDRAVLEDLIKRLSRCQACNMLDNWMEKSSDYLVQKEIIKCIDNYNQLIKKTGAENAIPVDDMGKARDIIRSLIFDYISEK